jgi:hypothetical protein
MASDPDYKRVDRYSQGEFSVVLYSTLANYAALSTYLDPPVPPQHGVAYLVHESSSSGEECALRIRQ